MSALFPTLPTHTFDWGVIKWFVSPGETPGAAITFGEVVLLPGKGHDRHNHPESEEILYVLSGVGEQTVADGEPFAVGPGATIYIPTAIYHSTRNTGAGSRCASPGPLQPRRGGSGPDDVCPITAPWRRERCRR